MRSINALIIDDELQSRDFLKKILRQNFAEFEIIRESATVEEGLNAMKEFTPDIVFLDIQMNGETGFDFLKKLDEINFALIFTTAFDQYAIKAFRFNAIDYLLKPIVKEELAEAVNKVKKGLAAARPTSMQQLDQLYSDIKNPQKINDKIALPTAEGFIIIPLNEIVYCRANSNYTEFYLTGNKCVLSSYPLKQYDEILTLQAFFRVHRSYLINMAHVKMYRRGEGGEIIMTNGHEIELSRTHKDEFLHLLNIRQ